MDGTTSSELRATTKVTELPLSRHRGDGTVVVLADEEKPISSVCAIYWNWFCTGDSPGYDSRKKPLRF